MSGWRTRVPAFAAGIDRSAGWWASRTPRERVMLMVLGAVAAAFVLIFLVILPLDAARSDARAEIRANEAYAAQLLASSPGSGAAPQRTGPPMNVISDSAIAAGVIANTEPIEGGVRATVADAPYPAVLAWIADLARTTPYRPRRISIERRPGPGRVSATLDLGT